jgi:hypothetical protein
MTFVICNIVCNISVNTCLFLFDYFLFQWEKYGRIVLVFCIVLRFFFIQKQIRMYMYTYDKHLYNIILIFTLIFKKKRESFGAHILRYILAGWYLNITCMIVYVINFLNDSQKPVLCKSMCTWYVYR